jgi:TPR repeat protein
MTRALIAATLAAAMFHPFAVRADGSWNQAIEALGDYNYPKAVSLIQGSARGGDVRAQEMLGLMLIHGEALVAGTLQPDRAEALSWLSQAAAGGSEVAQHLLRRWAARGHADAVNALAAAGLE